MYRGSPTHPVPTSQPECNNLTVNQETGESETPWKLPRMFPTQAPVTESEPSLVESLLGWRNGQKALLKCSFRGESLTWICKVHLSNELTD